MNTEPTEYDRKKFQESDHQIIIPDVDPTLWEKISDFFAKKVFHNFLRKLDASTFEAYLAIPEKDRQYLGWYLYPYAMEWKRPVFFGSNGDDDGSEFSKVDAHLKKKYPVQFFLRDTVIGTIESKLSYYRNYWWYRKVSTFFNPRQKWLTKQIPNTWCDKTTLIPQLNFAMIVHFVDVEKCFENTVYDDSPEHIKFASELKECYNFIKVVLPELEKQRDASYPTTYTGDYYKDYGELNRLEKIIDEETTKWLVWIVTNRNHFWV
jgi:hypothetical protein